MTKKILKQQSEQVAALLLRVGLAFVLIYAAISAFQNPDVWVGYLPHAIAKMAHARFVLHLLSVAQLGLAVWLLIGRYIKLAAALTALFLLGAVLANVSSMIIVFRDIGLIFMAAALYYLE